MAAIISFSHLTTEKKFRRLLLSTEKLLEEKSIEDWKLNQFVKALTDMLNDMWKSMNRPSSKQLDQYKQRIDILRENIDSAKLEDQTFPRQVIQQTSTDIPPVKEQQLEITTTSILSTEIENNLNTSNKPNRPNLNRQQQHIQSEEDKQNEIATSMSITTKSLLNNAKLIHDVVKNDQKKLTEAENLVDTNVAKLNIQSKRLKHNAYKASNCWIYLMLLVVIFTFIYLTLFMRMFRKRTVTITYSNSGSQSSLLNLSNNQTTINTSNVTTTTESTDYISFLLNYANENYTDL